MAVSGRGRPGGGQQPRARITPAFYGLVAFAVICAVTTAVVGTGTVAGLAFAGLVITLFVLLNAVVGAPRGLARRGTRPRRRAPLGAEFRPSDHPVPREPAPTDAAGSESAPAPVPGHVDGAGAPDAPGAAGPGGTQNPFA